MYVFTVLLVTILVPRLALALIDFWRVYGASEPVLFMIVSFILAAVEDCPCIHADGIVVVLHLRKINPKFQFPKRRFND